MTERAPTALPTSLLSWANLSSPRGATGETPALRGDPVVQLALVALELNFCVLERASTRAVLNETDEMDGGCRTNLAHRILFVARA